VARRASPSNHHSSGWKGACRVARSATSSRAATAARCARVVSPSFSVIDADASMAMMTRLGSTLVAIKRRPGSSTRATTPAHNSTRRLSRPTRTAVGAPRVASAPNTTATPSAATMAAMATPGRRVSATSSLALKAASCGVTGASSS
jgi:hypothetical protein